ncbi:MAG: hypothetical protein UH625_01590 [Muribaculaceae bacterium]|nr:hypothetical protein [Muribaculaceae bacterium]
MTPQELFDLLMAWPQPTRTEILNHIEALTRNYEPERVEALLADFAEMLFQWKCGKTYDRAKWEYDERERQHRAVYDERYSAFEVQLNFAEYALAMGTNEPIEWPEEPEPYEPLPFIPPMPGTIADNIHIPAKYNYAVDVLQKRLDPAPGACPGSIYLPSGLDTDRARKYFARAVEAGYTLTTSESDSITYKWKFGGERGGKARLGYFLECVYCPKPTDKLNSEQLNQLEALFDVKRLDRTISQNADTGKSQSVKNWRAEIDNNIFFD